MLVCRDESVCVQPSQMHDFEDTSSQDRLPPQGYATEGNEHSWFMLISSAFVLNSAEWPGQFVVHPWVASVNNQPTTAAQLRGVRSALLTIH